ncbi:MAG: FAD-dependent oxidoreductase [Candidatus Thermoplasmatota archaeon]|nr:FAD-dependent oxidoreductase [Candidatus Thermoplasmatota archaeon]MBS3789514.1 FAD-dependent oxidoreductase [Candidatus Thermoplasmatota archaeon]
MSERRIFEHPILDFDRGYEFYFDFEGKKIKAYEGETIASALYADGLRKFTESKKLERPRGFFCAIGKCSSCLMSVDGRPNIRTCVTLAEEGMEVERHGPKAEFPQTDVGRGGERKKEEIEIAVIGGGPAGLMASIVAARNGSEVHLFDEGDDLGGQLVKQTHQFFGSHQEDAGTRGIDIGKELLEEARDVGVEIHNGSKVLGYYPEKKITIESDGRLEIYDSQGIVYAGGAVENYLSFENNDLPGVYGAGGVQTLMNEEGIVPGEKVLMIGSGNVGLIVGYQLLQAGVNVVEIIEALPEIGGYQVHASKIRRAGVPIRASHTIKKAIGDEKVEGAVVQKIDENWNPVKGTEREVECDVICLAVGLSPDTGFLRQADCEMDYVPELGGFVPLRTEDMMTTQRGIYVAGDAAGIEEATVAALEGKIAGAAIYEELHEETEDTRRSKEEAKEGLDKMRKGPYGEVPKQGVKTCTVDEEVCG